MRARICSRDRRCLEFLKTCAKWQYAITPICIVQAICKALFGAQNPACDGVEMAHPADCSTAIVAILAMVVGRSHVSRRARRDHAGEGAGAPRGVLCGDGSGVSDGNVAAFLEVDEVGVGGDVRTVGCNLCAFLEETRKVLGVGNPEEVGVECVNVLWGSLE